MAKKTTTKKAPAKKVAPKKAPAKKVETVTKKEIIPKKVDISQELEYDGKKYKRATAKEGSHRVLFLPNGVNPRLGIDMVQPSATNAIMFAKKGWGDIVENA